MLRLLIILVLCGGTLQVAAQKNTHKQPAGKVANADDEEDETYDIELPDEDIPTSMSSALSRNLPMARDGSGTAWNPNATPVFGHMWRWGKCMFLAAGDAFPRYNVQDITRAGSRGGGDKLDAPAIFSLKGQRRSGRHGLFHFTIKASPDALIAGNGGYPLLFQTGAVEYGRALPDHQYPNELFTELSVSYARALSERADVFVYLGYPGDPALGPGAYMYRPSGRFMPDAPLGHQWADATHSSYGTGTAGFRLGMFRLEASTFTAREADDSRLNFDIPRFDSRSGRLSFSPSENWSFQVSHGYIKSPAALYPAREVYRTSGSASYVRPLRKRSFIAATAIWGENKSAGQTAQAALLEATVKLKKTAIYTRCEWVQKSAAELNITLPAGANALYAVPSVTLGGAYDVAKTGPATIAAGLQLSATATPPALTAIYGTYPFSAQVYIHIYPQQLKSMMYQ